MGYYKVPKVKYNKNAEYYSESVDPETKKYTVSQGYCQRGFVNGTTSPDNRLRLEVYIPIQTVLSGAFKTIDIYTDAQDGIENTYSGWIIREVGFGVILSDGSRKEITIREWTIKGSTGEWRQDPNATTNVSNLLSRLNPSNKEISYFYGYATEYSFSRKLTYLVAEVRLS